MHMPSEIESIRYHGVGYTHNGEVHISHLDISNRYKRHKILPAESIPGCLFSVSMELADA